MDRFRKIFGLKPSTWTEVDVTIRIPKPSFYISSTFRGFTPDGRYVHDTPQGRATYHPGYYAIDGRLLNTDVLKGTKYDANSLPNCLICLQNRVKDELNRQGAPEQTEVDEKGE